MTLDEIEKLVNEVITKYGTLADKPSVHLSIAVLAMLPVVREAQLWQRQIIGERTSYDLRLEAALDEFASAIHDHATSASEGK
jgi:hypothetical protein